MRAASREALAQVRQHIDTMLKNAENTVPLAKQTGAELFLAVEQLDQNRPLRVAVANSAAESGQRTGIMTEVFQGKVADSTLEVLRAAAECEWSTPREMRSGLVQLGRHALLRGAEAEGQLGQVEEELFQLSRILDREGELTQLLSDRTETAERRRSLLANVLYGKVTTVTEALALQVIGRPELNPADDVKNLAVEAAALTGRTAAHVKSAAELNEGQRSALAEKLGRIYGQEMSIHSEVDPSLLGGMIIRVGDEVIDGSTRGKLTRLRANLATTNY
ncbi:F0F1 ATP synthase subunit delta [Corynebacterium cystitidis]|uniref:ATP synthase subunit delta n=1 Tax=Corynebacterium cystitidis DSM 20524 TaxID=1121357 RepID=A0A1H9S3J9_9CORY|nr:F0F1 ATP synthase subunit delta [Corynebacterium cystitidis]WJY82179.1 ATP synthase subunit delta [Corynebacterium cystitidis DSM 20524]SER78923.1 ATP synthase F1 subcomplex delta subunit [Corynebacterium cystitidis DSM 20524]SNV78159.1 F0F1 ATP synthase subunit delta [Corynebacterium cystitidis]